jgi:hypothetical protein
VGIPNGDNARLVIEALTPRVASGAKNAATASAVAGMATMPWPRTRTGKSKSERHRRTVFMILDRGTLKQRVAFCNLCLLLAHFMYAA